MRRVQWFLCCAVVALFAAFMPCGTMAQIEGQTSPSDNSETPSSHRQCVGDYASPSVERIKQALASPLKSGGLDFVDTQLEEVVAFLQDDYNIPIQMDSIALEDIGVGPDEPVNFHVKDISLQSALRLILRRLGLTYVIQDEVLLITTPEAEEAELVLCVYDVRDLTGKHEYDEGSDALVDTIVRCVEPTSWAENGGGDAEISFLEPGVLVVLQSSNRQQRIADLLDRIRSVPREQDGTAVNNSAAGDPVVTRYYRISPILLQDHPRVGSRLVELIAKLLPDVQWEGALEDGSSVLIATLPDRIVVKHKRSVQAKVDRVLREMGATGGFGIGGGFGGSFGGGFGGGGYGGGDAKDAGKPATTKRSRPRE